MRRAFAAVGFAALAGALLSSFATVTSAATRPAGEKPATFLIPASDGYGIADCLLSNHACGAVVADAWCESHGFARAQAYGAAPREDFTGSVSAVPVSLSRAAPPLSITCAP